MEWSGVPVVRLERVLNQVMNDLKCSAEELKFFLLGRYGVKLPSEGPIGVPT